MSNNKNFFEKQVILNQEALEDEDTLIELIAEPIIQGLREQFGDDFDYSQLEGSFMCITQKSENGEPDDVDEDFVLKVQDYVKERLMEDQIPHFLH